MTIETPGAPAPRPATTYPARSAHRQSCRAPRTCTRTNRSDYLREAYSAEVQAGRLTQEQANKLLAEDTGTAPDANGDAQPAGPSEVDAFLQSEFGITPGETRAVQYTYL